MQEQVAQLLPKREGHFAFESGHHGEVWLDLELLFLRPERVQPLAEALADRLRSYEATAVCGPLVEGAFVGLMVAASLRLPFSYSEPVRDHRATGLFPVSYPIPKSFEPKLRGKRVVIVNDVINAGSAVRGTLASLKECGAQPIAIGTLAVYGGAASDLAATHRRPGSARVVSKPDLGAQRLSSVRERRPIECVVAAASNNRMNLTALRAARYPERSPHGGVTEALRE